MQREYSPLLTPAPFLQFLLRAAFLLIILILRTAAEHGAEQAKAITAKSSGSRKKLVRSGKEFS